MKRSNSDKDKKTVTQKQTLLGIFILLGGMLSMALLIIFIVIPAIQPSTGKNPVLGVTINGVPPNPAFTDSYFYACVLDGLNSSKIDGKSDRTYAYSATDSELAKLGGLDCNNYNKADDLKIADVSGLEKMTGLTYLRLYNNKIKAVNLSKNTLLKELLLYSNQLSTINLSNNTNLDWLDLSNNTLTEIVGINSLTKITHMYLRSNKFTGIDVLENKTLTVLSLSENQLSKINVEQNTSLNTLSLGYNLLKDDSITGLDKLSLLAYFSLDNNKLLTAINISSNPALKSLSISNDPIISLDTSKNTLLEQVIADDCALQSIDFSNNPNLKTVWMYGNKIKSINTDNNLKLQSLLVSDNQLTSIDVSKNKALGTLWVSENQLSSIDVSQNIALKSLAMSGPKITSLDVSKNTALTAIQIYSSSITNLDLSANLMLDHVALTDNRLLSSLAGLDKLTKLKNLYVYSSALVSVDVGASNLLDNLDLSKCPKLTNLTLNSASLLSGRFYLSSTPLLSTITIKNNSGDVVIYPAKNIAKIKLNYLASNLNPTLIGKAKRAIEDKTISTVTVINSSNTTLAGDTMLKTGDVVRGLYSGGSVDIKLAVKGDVVPDGKVLINDVAKLFQHYKGTTPMADTAEIEAGDVTGDGKIQINDVAKLFQYFKGDIKEL